MRFGRLILMFSLLFTASAQAERVLVIGDSHTVGTFGHTLDQGFRNLNSTSVQTYGSCGSVIGWWYSGQATPCGYWSSDELGRTTSATNYATPKILSLFKNTKPELVVIALGSNYVRGYSDIQTRAEIQKLLTDVKNTGARCAWIGPPDMRRFRTELPALVDLIQNEVSSTCLFIDSRIFTAYDDVGGDGVHYETPALKKIAEFWAESVIARIQAASLPSTQPSQTAR